MEIGFRVLTHAKLRRRRKTNNPSFDRSVNEGQWKASQGFTSSETLTKFLGGV